MSPSIKNKKREQVWCRLLNKFKEVHSNNLYSYTKSVYEKRTSKIEIDCKIHGSFFQTPDKHIMGQGCPSCKGKSKIDTPLYIQKAKEVHGDYYDYSLVYYITAKTNIIIVCKKHGQFKQRPDHHLGGSGCKKCADISKKQSLLSNKPKFLTKIDNFRKNKNDYSESVYVNAKYPMKINCTIKNHGEFYQTPNNHLKGEDCPKCSNTGPSRSEQEVYSYINNIISAEQSNRNILKGKELDIYIPSKKLAIEFNGLYWHSDEFKKDTYHINKTKQCEKENINLIHIFEDEWSNKKEIVKSRLSNILGNTLNKIYARKTEIKQVPTSQAMQFLEESHIQGKVGGKVKLGLYYDNELVSLMTFGKLRKNLGSNHKDGHWELLRFCNKLNTTVVGGFSKLLKHFQKSFKWVNIVSYADLRWSQGNVYFKNGFQEEGRSFPSYFYFNTKEKVRKTRFKFRKSELVKQGFDPNKTERQIMKERGFLRIYDCGTIKFKLIKK